MNRFDVLAREAEDAVAAAPDSVDAHWRDEIFQHCESGENTDTESIPSLDFQENRSVSEDRPHDGVSITDAPEAGGFPVSRRCGSHAIVQTTRSREEIRATSHEGCMLGRHHPAVNGPN